MPDSDGPVFDTNSAGDGIIRANKFAKTGRHMRLYGPSGNLYWNDEQVKSGTITASEVTVLDAGGLFTASDVEAALAELKADIMANRGIVSRPQDWGSSPGLHFWAVFADSDLWESAGSSDASDLHGWQLTATTIATPNSGDFGSAADHAFPYLDLGANLDMIISPEVFGSYPHMLMASRFMNDVMPTMLHCEIWARFATASANETTSGFGLVTSAPSPDSLQVAYIRSNGSNFQIRNSLDSDAGPAIDTNYHLWKIEAQATGIQWFIDGVSQGTMTIDPVDMWPAAFGALAATTNRVEIGWVHIWYS